MASIKIVGVGTSDLTALKRNFANLLQEKYGAKQPVTLAEAISRKGLDEKHQVSLLRRRARRAERQDRPKCFATDRTTSLYTGYWTRGAVYTPDHASRDLATLRNPPSTADYVSAWTRLNHLKEVA